MHPGGLVNHRASEQSETPHWEHKCRYSRHKGAQKRFCKPGAGRSCVVVSERGRKARPALTAAPAEPKSSCCSYLVLFKLSDLPSVAIAPSTGRSLASPEQGWGGREGVQRPRGLVYGLARLWTHCVAWPERPQEHVVPLEITCSRISPAVSIISKMPTCKGRFVGLYLGKKQTETLPTPSWALVSWWSSVGFTPHQDN